MRLNQPQDRMPPLATSADTDENGRVCVDGLGPYALRCCSSHNRSSDGLLIRTIRMRRMHHMRGGADDVTGLSTAALTASTHANRRGRGSEVLLSLPCDGSQQSCCW